MGQSEKGMAMLSQALTEIERTGEKVDQAEILRLKGEITDDAEGGAYCCFPADLRAGFDRGSWNERSSRGLFSHRARSRSCPRGRMVGAEERN
jgi:hypothetical protein